MFLHIHLSKSHFPNTCSDPWPGSSCNLKHVAPAYGRLLTAVLQNTQWDALSKELPPDLQKERYLSPLEPGPPNSLSLKKQIELDQALTTSGHSPAKGQSVSRGKHLCSRQLISILSSSSVFPACCKWSRCFWAISKLLFILLFLTGTTIIQPHRNQ